MSFSVYRNKSTGRLNWIGVYTNNAMDDDYPPEVISRKSIVGFTERANRKELAMPELWVWHIKALKVGKATWLSFDEVDGITFGIAGGEVDEVAEPLVKQLVASGWNAMSHAMPRSSLVYEDTGRNGDRIIVQHVTDEITLLPRYGAANKYTVFAVQTKETTMTEQEFSRIVDAGADPEALTAVLEANAGAAKSIKEDQRLTKSAGDEPAQEDSEATKSSGEPAEEKAAAKKPDPKSEEEETEEDMPKKQASELTISVEIEEAVVKQVGELATISDGIISKLEAQAQYNNQQVELITALNKSLNDLRTEVESLKSQLSEARIGNMKSRLDNTPVTSLASLLAEVNGGSAIGAPETQVDGRTKLGKSAPEPPKEEKGNGLFFEKWLS